MTQKSCGWHKTLVARRSHGEGEHFFVLSFEPECAQTRELDPGLYVNDQNANEVGSWCVVESIPEPCPFKVGDEVECCWQGGDLFYAGVVERVNRDQTMFINYTDGDEEDNVPAHLVRAVDVGLEQHYADDVMND